METLNRLPFRARKSVFDKLERIVDIAALSKEEREKYDESIKVYRDNLAVMAYAEEKGRAEGRAEERIKNVRNLKNLGIDLETIAKATELSLEEVMNL